MAESPKLLPGNERRLKVYGTLVANKIAVDTATRTLDAIAPQEPVSRAYDILTEVIENLFRLRQEFASDTRSSDSGERTGSSALPGVR